MSSKNRRLSLDPHVRLRVDKLEVALKYLGIDPSEGEKLELRRCLNIDQSGMVSYGEFVAVCRDLFKMQLDDTSLGSGVLAFAAHDVTDFAKPLPIKQQEIPDSVPISEFECLRKERDDALRTVGHLKAQLKEKDHSFNLAEEELLRIRKEAQGAIHESRALKSRVHLAEMAQHEARNIEIDYEQVVHMLEAEVSLLKKKVLKTPPPFDPSKNVSSNVEKLQKRLAVLSCELRKAQVSKKTYEVSTEKLLRFAELVHQYLSNCPSLTVTSSGHGESARHGGTGFLPPGYPVTHSKQTPFTLVVEAKETVKAVQKMLEVEPLPYGWEEAYTEDGMKYYLNHVTLSSTWIHPVSSVNHLVTIEDAVDTIQETRAQ